MALTYERVACAFQVEACCDKYVPRKFPVAFVICIRANQCLLGFSKCFRNFVGLLSPSGCDSFWEAANSTGAFLFIRAWMQNFTFYLACVPVLRT
ncbi:hypothetical protein ACSBR2_022062 [Camellia fascicularis]